MMLKREDTVAVVIDAQERLMPVIDRGEDVSREIVKLLEGLNVLRVPALVTEQYPDALGATLPAIKERVEATPISKLSFSCCGVEEFNTSLERMRRRHVLVVGVETHVCVYQTVRDLLATGYQVSVVVDAVGSRTPENKAIALRRMEALGANLVSVEMVLFEVLQKASGPQFKAILKVVK